MGTPSSTSHLLGGTLILSPTHQGGPSYGGTQLGTMQGIGLQGPIYVADELLAEEYGGEPIDELHLHEIWIATIVLANWDTDGLKAGFPLVSDGTGGAAIIQAPGLDPGVWWSTKAKDVFLAPSDYESGGGLRLYNCLIRPDRSGIVQFSHYADPFLVLTLKGIRNSSNQIARISRLVDSGLAAAP